MTKTFDVKATVPVRPGDEGKTRAPRPRDAATLILIKKIKQKYCVLMGQRHSGHKFMPDRYVFPGGRVDRADGHAPHATDMQPRVRRHLEKAANAHRARAIALAAIRETFEETGLILGEKPSEMPKYVPASWRPFAATGYLPALHRLEYLCRAITPPYRSTRFNARFLIANGNNLSGDIEGSGELIHLDWIPIDKAMSLHLPNITLRVLKELGGIIEDPDAFKRRQQTALYHMVHGRQLQATE